MLIKAWFSLISAILALNLLILVANFHENEFLYWFALLILITAIILTFLVYLEKPYIRETKKMQKTYVDYLKQKDRRIEELSQKSNLLFKTAMKKSENDLELNELKRKWEEKMKEGSSQ